MACYHIDNKKDALHKEYNDNGKIKEECYYKDDIKMIS